MIFFSTVSEDIQTEILSRVMDVYEVYNRELDIVHLSLVYDVPPLIAKFISDYAITLVRLNTTPFSKYTFSKKIRYMHYFILYKYLLGKIPNSGFYIPLLSTVDSMKRVYYYSYLWGGKNFSIHQFRRGKPFSMLDLLGDSDIVYLEEITSFNQNIKNNYFYVYSEEELDTCIDFSKNVLASKVKT